MHRSLLLTLALALCGCATTFTGSAHIEGGRAGCERQCASDGLKMSGLVYMGEYSSACVCEVPAAPASSATAGASASASAVGVIMQMREQERRDDNALSASMSMPR